MPWSIVSTRYTDDNTAEVLDIVCRRSNVFGVTDVFLENANRKVLIANVSQSRHLLGRPWTLHGFVDPNSTLRQIRYTYARVGGFANRRYAIIERLKQMGIYQRDQY